MHMLTRPFSLVLLAILLSPHGGVFAAKPPGHHEQKKPHPASALGTPIMAEGFEVASFPPAGWTQYQTDGNASGSWGYDSAYYPCYYKGQAACWARIPGSNPPGARRWLVTPQLTIPEAGAELAYQDSAHSGGAKTPPYYDHVLVTTSSIPDPTTATYEEVLELKGHGWCSWKEIDLNAYAGKKIYIAFRHTEDNATEWFVDTVVVTPRTMMAKFEKAVVIDDLCAGAGGSHNTFIEQGETITLDLLVKNTGAVSLTDATATLTSLTSGVTINSGSATFPVMAPGEVRGANDPKPTFTVSSSLACGATLDFKLKVSSAGESEVSYFTLYVYQNQTPIDEKINDCDIGGCSWPYGWTLQGTTGYFWRPDNFETSCTSGADDGALTVCGSASETDSWAFADAIPMMPGVVYTLSYKERTSSGTSNPRLSIWAGTAAKDSGMSIGILPETAYSNSSCETVTRTFTVPAAGDYYIGWHATGAGSCRTLFVDDILLTASLDCQECKADTTAPAATITSGPSGIINSSTASFAWSGSDNATPAEYLKYSYYLQGKEAGYGAWSSLTSAVYTGLADGSYTLWVKSKDEAGNESAAASQSFTVDATKPAASITEGPSGTIGVNTAKFVWTGSDNLTPAGSLKYAYYLAGKDGGYGAWSSSTTYTYTGLANGSYTFYVKSKDEAGNESDPASRAFTVALAGYSISGKILTYDGKACSGVTVSAGGKSATTGSDGSYLIKDLAAGTYTVKAARSGYTFGPSSRDVTIASSNLAWIDFSETTGGETMLKSGVAKSGAASAGGYAYYYIPVPARATKLEVQVTGVVGDVDLYARLGMKPNKDSVANSHLSSAWLGVADETVVEADAAAGNWWIAVYGKTNSSFTIKATYTVGTGQPTDILLNKKFEWGPERVWRTTTSPKSHQIVVNATSPVEPKQGVWDAHLCAMGANALNGQTDKLHQYLWIPANISKATLSFWVYIATNETGSQANDKLTVQVFNNGKYTTLKTLSNLDKGGSWVKISNLDMTSFKGSTTLYFIGTSNSTLPTWFVLDDMSLQVTQ